MKRAFYPADILLPRKGTNMSKWSVIACDQFTSMPAYWEQTEQIVGTEPSTLRMILPEVYLDGPQEKDRLEKIRCSMETYLTDNIFAEYKNAMIYLERTDSSGHVRAGIVGCIDLEEYDYHKGSCSLVRATEATVEERIPPRIRIRENAKVELPHIMILIDDRAKTVIEPCEQYKQADQLLYDFDLMQGGGHLTGYLLGETEQKKVLDALDTLAAHASGMVYAVGDGNHSLASAKAFYEQLKAANPMKDYTNHPARYALAEIVNLHSPALEFEAIHRIVYEADVEKLLSEMTEKLGLLFEKEEETVKKDTATVSENQEMYIVQKGRRTRAIITRPTSKLTVGSLQNFLDAYQQNNAIKMDYIHGMETVVALSEKKDSIGFLLPDMKKEELFPSVMEDGALPRKTFSMGHAEDKRYYTECRKIQ